MNSTLHKTVTFIPFLFKRGFQLAVIAMFFSSFSLSAQSPTIVETPNGIAMDSYGTGISTFNDWIANWGGGIVTPHEDCGEATFTNDYDYDNWNYGCSYYDGSVNVTFSYSDECDNVLNYTRTFTFFDETPPSCVKPYDLTINCEDEGYEATLASYVGYWGTVTDLSHPITIVSSYDENGFDENGQQVITWTFTDACGNSRQWDALLTVICDPAILIVTPPADYEVECGADLQLDDPIATTTCPGGVINVFEYEEFISMGCPGSYTLIRFFDVSDECGNSETVSQTITVVDTTAPIFFFVPENADVDCTGYPDGFGEPGIGEACGEYELTYEDILEEYICDADFNITRIWTATDECGNASTASQVLTVWPDVEEPTFTFVPGAETIECGQDLVFGTPEILDNCTGFQLSEEITSTGACPDGYTTTITWTAIDACGNAETASQTITVVGEPNEITLNFSFTPTDKTIECGASYEFGQPVCASNCDAGYSLTSEDTVSQGICENTQTITRVWTAVDACGNAAMCEQVITIVDTTAPEFTSVPGNKVVSCNEELVFGTPVTLDLCGGVTITSEDVTEYANCEGVSYTVSRTWFAEDACGNVAAATQTFTIEEDTEAPVFTAVEDKVVYCTEGIEFEAPTALDNCNAVEITYTDQTIADECENLMIRTWIAKDGCENIATTSQTITIIDDEKPFFNIQNEVITMSPSEYNNWVTPEVLAFDECSSVEINGPNVFEYNTGRIGYSWTAIDACGNKSGVSINVMLSPNPGLPNGTGISTTNGLSTFPNPTTGTLTTVFGSDNSGNGEVVVMDLFGRVYYKEVVTTYKGRNVVSLELNELPQGTYLVKVTDESNEMTNRFVKL